MICWGLVDSFVGIFVLLTKKVQLKKALPLWIKPETSFDKLN